MVAPLRAGCLDGLRAPAPLAHEVLEDSSIAGRRIQSLRRLALATQTNAPRQELDRLCLGATIQGDNEIDHVSPRAALREAVPAVVFHLKRRVLVLVTRERAMKSEKSHPSGERPHARASAKPRRRGFFDVSIRPGRRARKSSRSLRL
jgi:hypothetical protein